MNLRLYTVYLFNDKDECYDNEFGTPTNLLKYFDEEPNRFRSDIIYDLEGPGGVSLECFAKKQDIIQRLKQLNKL